MQVELASGVPPQLRITWPAYDPPTEAAILERLKTVPGAEGAGRRWYVPAIQMERLMILFPKASYQYAALCAADKAARDFFDSLIGTGITGTRGAKPVNSPRSVPSRSASSASSTGAQ